MEKKQVYFCKKCKNVVQALWNGTTAVSCCGEVMTKLDPATAEGAGEKHIPVIERDGHSVTVKVGEVAHPMQAEHYILFVELLVGNKVYRHDFVEGDGLAEAKFHIEEEGELVARAFCNLHGFWASK